MATRELTCRAALLFACLLLKASGQAIDVAVGTDGTYSVSWNNTLWLRSAPTFFILNNTTYSAADNSLTLLTVNETETSGYKSIDMYYSANGTTIVASVLDHYAGYYRFRVTYPEGANDTLAASRNNIICGFPGFQIPSPPSILAYLSFGGSFFTPSTGIFEVNNTLLLPGLLDSGPLVLFDNSSNGAVIGPSDSFMTTTVWQDEQRYVYWGITGLMTQLPADFQYNILLTGSKGAIGNAVSEWAMVLQSNLTTSALRKPLDSALDDTASSILDNLGYWTGPNSAYFSGPEENQTYEDTLINVKSTSIQNQIRYSYVELDTWWYEKGQGNMTRNWTAPSTVLPDGIGGLYKKTLQWPILAAGGQWAKDTTYATQNGGKYNFTVTDTCALPNDKDFWDDLLKAAKVDGVQAYIQYNMAEQYDCMTKSRSNDVSLIPGWLDHLYTSAKGQGLGLIYSGVLPRLALAASVGLKQSFVVQVGPGKFSDPDHWKVGVSSILASALGLRPFIGGLKSYKDDSDPKTQLPPRLYSLLATLSGGPVAYGDRIGQSDHFIVSNECCMSNGVLLRPARPVTAIDAQIQQMAWGGDGVKGEVWTTFTSTKFNSELKNFFSGIIVAADLQSPFNITPSSAGFNFVGEMPGETIYTPTKIFSFDNKEVLHDFADDKPFTLTGCTLAKYCLYFAAPVVKFRGEDVVIMGELNKWVPMSSQRVDNIQMTSDKITIKTIGQTGEKTFMYLHVNDTVKGFEHVIKSDDGIDYFEYAEGGNNSFACKMHAVNYIIVFCALAGLLMRRV